MSDAASRQRDHDWLCARAVADEDEWVREGDRVRLYDVGTGFTTAWRAVFVRDFKGEMRMRLVKDTES